MSRVLVLMPLYKQAPDLLRKAVTSILDQRGVAFELHVFTDGADHDTVDALFRLHGERPEFWIHHTGRGNRGIAFTLNEGHAYAQERGADFTHITWVSSDNYHFPLMLDRLVAGFEEDTAFVTARNLRYLPEEQRLEDPLATLAHQGMMQRKQIQPRDFITYGLPPCFMYLSDYASMRYDPEAEFAEDLDFFVRLLEAAYYEGKEGRRIDDLLMVYHGASPFSHTSYIGGSAHELFILRMGHVLLAAADLGHFPIEEVDTADPNWTSKGVTFDELPATHRIVVAVCEPGKQFETIQAFLDAGAVFHAVQEKTPW